MKGYLVIDDITLDEAKEIMSKLGKHGRWISQADMAKLDTAAAFAITTHGFPKVKPEDVFEF